MKLLRAFLIATAGLFLAGCIVRSINPFFAEQDIVAYSDAVGSWEQDDGKQTWTFKANGRRYEVSHVDEEKHQANFHAHFAKLGTNVFVDLFIDDPKFDDRINFVAVAHLVPAHSIAKVTKEDGNLVFYPLDYDWTKKQLELNPKVLPHVMQDNSPVLTASTAELKAFVVKHANDTNAFKNGIILKRKP